MQQLISLKLTPSEAEDHSAIRKQIAGYTGKTESQVTGYHKLKQSIDARSRQQVWINLQVLAFIEEPFVARKMEQVEFSELNPSSKRVVIIGAGPAGLFAALKLIESGLKPILLERGKDIRSRRRDLAILNKEGKINPESNYCFGEGGAGTYSDGKLYTRSTKRGDITRILNLFVQFGAEERILYEAHPHIGTNKLPNIIESMRKSIIQCGGEFHFEKKVTDFKLENGSLKAVSTSDGDLFYGDSFILATGHSARDIFTLLHQKNISIEAKPFALGVRIEHPQSLIDSIQYHCITRDKQLPPSSYSLVDQVNERAVFSFCMCPGGIIAPASTAPNELVVNGWSPSKRNNPFANSGMVVAVSVKDAFNHLKKEGQNIHEKDAPLLLLKFQQLVEQNAFKAGGGRFVAPAQRLVDFCNNKQSDTLPSCSYIPGLRSCDMKEVLPEFISLSLRKGLQNFGQKMHGYYSNEAILVGTESRTSSTVRIPRDPESLEHPQVKNLYPCGEGAGYAGGIVSAAMDGEKIAGSIVQKLNSY